VTTVCLLGDADVVLREELLSRETAADALSYYNLSSPFTNSVAVQTVSLGTAVSLCNDLDWYIRRFVDRAIIMEESISRSEWLSRSLAMTVRDQAIQPEQTRRYLAIYGLIDQKLTDPLYTQLLEGGTLPPYDLEPVDDIMIVRITEEEFKLG